MSREPNPIHDGQLRASELTATETEPLQKRSNRLVLETYNHCEVPAGCGGVVLRWVELDEPIRLGIRLHLPNATTDTTTLDGQKVPSSQLELAPNRRHALVIELVFNEHGSERSLMAALSTGLSSVTREAKTLTQFHLASRADALWTFTDQAPSQLALTELTEVSEAWRPVAVGHCAQPPEGSLNRWSWQRCVELGAVAIRLPSDERRLWLRVLIDL